MLLACHMVSPAADQDSGPAAAFARLKALAGRWEGQSQHGKATLAYELTGGDTVLVEHMQPMMTVYHLDGDRLVLTHYCMAGNQPRMAAKSYRPDTGEYVFETFAVGNAKNSRGGHMGSARIRLVSSDVMESEWTFLENGTTAKTVKSTFRRVK
jgi:hypothetical protein